MLLLCDTVCFIVALLPLISHKNPHSCVPLEFLHTSTILYNTVGILLLLLLLLLLENYFHFLCLEKGLGSCFDFPFCNALAGRLNSFIELINSRLMFRFLCFSHWRFVSLFHYGFKVSTHPHRTDWRFSRELLWRQRQAHLLGVRWRLSGGGGESDQLPVCHSSPLNRPWRPELKNTSFTNTSKRWKQAVVMQYRQVKGQNLLFLFGQRVSYWTSCFGGTVAREHTSLCSCLYFFKKRFLILNRGFTWPVAVWFSRCDSDGKSTVGTRRLPFFLQCNKTSPATPVWVAWLSSWQQHVRGRAKNIS